MADVGWYYQTGSKLVISELILKIQYNILLILMLCQQSLDLAKFHRRKMHRPWTKLQYFFLMTSQ